MNEVNIFDHSGVLLSLSLDITNRRTGNTTAIVAQRQLKHTRPVMWCTASAEQIANYNELLFTQAGLIGCSQSVLDLTNCNGCNCVDHGELINTLAFHVHEARIDCGYCSLPCKKRTESSKEHVASWNSECADSSKLS